MWSKEYMGSRNRSAEDDWDFYFCNVNDVLSSIMVNLGAIGRAPMARKPWLLWVCVAMRSPREDGLSSDQEAPTLAEIEDKLTDELRMASGAELLGRITGNNCREFYFYAPRNEGLGEAVAKVRESFPAYLIECDSQPDPEWRQYLDVLYPSPMDMHRIQNRRVLASLEEHGDAHSIPRPVDHAFYFRRDEDREAFVAAAIGTGFSVQNESEEAERTDERPFFLNLVRTDPVAIDHINQVVLELVELAERFDGDYDGWGCEVQVAS